jgi:hypothetical protein
MPILSAADAITPAIARTRLLLFTPLRKGRSWKLAATAYLAMAGTCFLPFPLLYLAFAPAVRTSNHPGLIVWLYAAVAVATLLYVWVFYLCSRLRFAFFDIAVNRGEYVAPAWRKYGPQSFKWTLFKVLLGALALLVAAVPLYSYFKHMFGVIAAMQPGQQPGPDFVGQVFGGYALFFLVYVLFGIFLLACAVLGDFIVPSLALEDTTLAEAFRRMGALMAAEPGQFLLYAVLKGMLGIASYIGVLVLFEIALVVVVLIVGAIVLLIGFLLHAVGVPLLLLYVVGGLFGFAFYLFAIVYALFFTMGTLMTFFECYALYFLSGRYPLLGELLERSTPPAPVYQVPGYPPPGYFPMGDVPPVPPPPEQAPPPPLPIEGEP